jgi:DNA-directed RNA polymerase subunit delta
MDQKLQELAMVDIAEHLIMEAKEPMSINDIFSSVAEIKGFELSNIDRLTQLYMDMTQSGKFVYCGDDLWDLKAFNLELWDEDGSRFIKHEEIEEDTEDDLDFEAFVLDDGEEVVDIDEELEEEIDEEEAEEKEYIDVELPIVSTDDDDEKDNDLDVEFDDDYDEDDYNEIMDDYEDMYDQ